MNAVPPHVSADDVGPQAIPKPRSSQTPRGRLRKVVLGLITVTLVVVVLVAGFVAWQVRRFSDIERVQVASVVPASGGAANWLFVGTDTRDGIEASDVNAGAFLGAEVSGIRTDTILIVRVDDDAGSVQLLSIPRDLWVPIAGRGQSGRINGAFNADGSGRGDPERLVATIEGALGIEINHYAEVDFVGFRDVVDAVGGVSLSFDHPARDVRSGLVIDRSGEQHLDGDQALAFARSRAFEELVEGRWQQDPTGDLGRTERQRQLVSRLVDGAGRAISPTGFLTLDRLLSAAADSMVLDQRTDLSATLNLVRTAAGVGAEAMVSHALPVSDHRTSGGAAVLMLREGEAQPILDRFRSS